MKIGERIRYVRNSKNITQSALADSIHISPSFMNRIENGSSEPSIYIIRAIAEALHSTPQEFSAISSYILMIYRFLIKLKIL